MKVMIDREKLDVNSFENRELYLKGQYVGTYNYGLYSKVIYVRAFIDNKPIGIFENFICGLLHKYFEVEIDNSADVISVMNLCKIKEKMELIDWINRELLKIGNRYDESKC